MSEDAQQDAGQQGAVLPTHMGQSIDHMELFQQDQLWGYTDNQTESMSVTYGQTGGHHFDM